MSKREVFNSSIGNPADFVFPKLTSDQEIEILSGLFEQLLLFDKVVISTNRVNFALVFLISKLGINTVEKLFENGYIELLLWTPVIFTNGGQRNKDGSFDRSKIYGQPPLFAGSLGEKDLDPEENIKRAILGFNFHRDRNRIFIRKLSKKFIVPNGMEYSSNSAKMVIDAYENNNLSNLGLPFEKESNQLDFNQRQKLLFLGHKALETAIISKYNYKTFENYEPYEICKSNLENIGKAYNVVENSSAIFNLENIPDLKTLFKEEKLNFDDVFKYRNLSNAKYYRKWINEVGDNNDAKEITREYLNQLKGSNKFFNTNGGKFLRNISMFGIGTGLGAALAGPPGAAAGFGLGLLDTYVLEGILKGKNPSMFIDDIRKLTTDNE